MGNKSTQLARLNTKPYTEGKGTKAYKLVLDYTRVDGDGEKKPMKASKFVESLTELEKTLLKTVNVGDEVVITKEEKKYTNKEGKEATAWNLTTIADKSTWVEKPKKQWGGKQSGGGYDSLGNQVGNCVTNAIASLGAGKTIEQYKERMLELAEAGDWLRNLLENKTKSAIPTLVKAEDFSTETFNKIADSDSFDLDDDVLDDLGSVEF